jgi:RNA recognition motif-containing protein
MDYSEKNKILQEKNENFSKFSSQFPDNQINTKSDNFASLFVGDLPLNLPQKDIEKIFLKIGPLKSIKIYKDLSSGDFLGYCIIEFENSKDAEKALNELNFYFDPKKNEKTFTLDVVSER